MDWGHPCGAVQPDPWTYLSLSLVDSLHQNFDPAPEEAWAEGQTQEEPNALRQVLGVQLCPHVVCMQATCKDN